MDNQDTEKFTNYMLYDGLSSNLSYITFSDYVQLDSIVSYIFDGRLIVAVYKRDQKFFEAQYQSSLSSGKLLFVK